MAKKMSSISSTPSDTSLTPNDGWIGMDLKWLVSKTNLGSKHITVGKVTFAAGGDAEHVLHRHPNAEEAVLVLKGHADAIIGDETMQMGPGDVCYIPQGVPHTHRNLSPDEPFEAIFIYGGASCLEDAGYERV